MPACSPACSHADASPQQPSAAAWLAVQVSVGAEGSGRGAARHLQGVQAGEQRRRRLEGPLQAVQQGFGTDDQVIILMM